MVYGKVALFVFVGEERLAIVICSCLFHLWWTWSPLGD